MGGICLGKRDWRQINMVLVGEADRFFRIAKKVVWEEPEPWTWKPKYKDDNKRILAELEKTSVEGER
jgi:hypothetical protein